MRLHVSDDVPIPTGRRLNVGPVAVSYLRRDEALAIVDGALQGGDPVRVAFCNANMLLQALDRPSFARALAGFLVLNDGIGMNLCSRLFTGQPFRDNLNGTDFVPDVLRSSRPALRIFLLGGAPGTAEAAAARLGTDHPRHIVVGTRHGFFEDRDIDAVAEDIARAAPDLLLVGMGNPRQEEFIAAAGARLPVPVIMAVGAFLDFQAGRVVRAPAALRRMRAEWLFRLAQEPRRLGRRYTVDVAAFLFRIALLRLKAGPTLRDA